MSTATTTSDDDRYTVYKSPGQDTAGDTLTDRRSPAPELGTKAFVTCSRNGTSLSVYMPQELEVEEDDTTPGEFTVYTYKRGVHVRASFEHPRAQADPQLDSLGRARYTITHPGDLLALREVIKAVDLATAGSAKDFASQDAMTTRVAVDTGKITSGLFPDLLNGLHPGFLIFGCRPEQVQSVRSRMAKAGKEIFDVELPASSQDHPRQSI